MKEREGWNKGAKENEHNFTHAIITQAMLTTERIVSLSSVKLRNMALTAKFKAVECKCIWCSGMEDVCHDHRCRHHIQSGIARAGREGARENAHVL